MNLEVSFPVTWDDFDKGTVEPNTTLPDKKLLLFLTSIPNDFMMRLLIGNTFFSLTTVKDLTAYSSL